MKYTAKRTIQVWICVSYVCLFLSSSAVTGQCDDPGPLGMEDGTILNDQLSASFNTEYAINARLDGNSAWRAAEEPNGVDITNRPAQGPWIQVDFEGPVYVTGIATQGRRFRNGEDRKAEYVKLYQVAYTSTTGGPNRWKTIKTSNREPVEFFGPQNDDDVYENGAYKEPVRRDFVQGVDLQYIRIYPTDCQVRCSLQFELYGCEVPTTTPPATATHPPARPTTTTRPQETTTMKARRITATTAQTTTPTRNIAATSMTTITQPAGMSASDSITFSSSSTTPFEGWIAGIVIGAFVLVSLVAVCLFLIMRRNKRRPEDKQETQRDEARNDVNNDVIVAPVNTKPPVYATIKADDTSNENALNDDNEYAYAYTPQQGDGLSSSKTGTNSSTTVAKEAQTSSDCAYAYAEPYGKDVPQHDQGEYAYAYTEGNTSSPTVGGQYSPPQEGWEENSIYA